MSGLVLPTRKPHWRPDWSAMLMALKLTSGHLTRTPGNHLALCTPCEYCPEITVSTIEVTIAGAPFCAAVNGTFSITIDCLETFNATFTGCGIENDTALFIFYNFPALGQLTIRFSNTAGIINDTTFDLCAPNAFSGVGDIGYTVDVVFS